MFSDVVLASNLAVPPDSISRPLTRGWESQLTLYQAFLPLLLTVPTRYS